MLSIFTDEQAENATKAVKRVVREVGTHVQELLSGADYESFRAGLDQVAQQARETWHILQHARKNFEPNFELSHNDDLKWEALVMGEVEKKSLSNASEEDEELLVIFPPIYLLKDAAPYPVTSGVALMRSQSTAAAKEIERKSPPSPVVGKTVPRQRPTRFRNKSASFNSGTEFQPYLLC